MSEERLIIENMFMIDDKEGRDVPFVLNTAQRYLDENLTGRDIIPKARQEGVSAYILALLTVRCLWKRNRRAVVISHDTESTQRMLRRVKYYLDNIRGPKPILEYASKNELTFPKTHSMFYIGTAGAKKFGRGDTITDLHCSEVAFWPDPKSLTAGLFQAVPRSGSIVLESTGNGMGWYYKRCMAAAGGQSRYAMHFLSWTTFPEYTLDLSAEEEQEIINSLDPDFEEDILYHDRGLTPGQIAWRRDKLEEMDWDIDLFKQEYPMTLDECFRASGRSIFSKVLYEPTDRWRRIDQYMHILGDHPHPWSRYVVGVDVGGGVGQDNSVMEVIDLKHLTVVAEWASNKIAPDILGERIAELATWFQNAYVVVESNNHGIVTVNELRKVYPPNLIYSRSVPLSGRPRGDQHSLMLLGQRTTSVTKPLMIARLRHALSHFLTIHNPLLKSELDTFIETESGRMEADQGCFDDRVMALACAVWGIDRAMIAHTSDVPEERLIEADPFSLDRIINELQGRRGGTFPVKRHIRRGLG